MMSGDPNQAFEAWVDSFSPRNPDGEIFKFVCDSRTCFLMGYAYCAFGILNADPARKAVAGDI